MSEQTPLHDPTRELYDSIRGLVSRNPEADKLRESLATSFTYDLKKGQDITGATLKNSFVVLDAKAPAEADPSLLFTSAYAKPSAGVTMPVTYGATDTQDVYVLLGRKWKDPQNHVLGLQEEHVLVGGYMNPHHPGETGSTTPFDHNLAETARREFHEETGLALPASYVPTILGSDSEWGVSNDSKEHTVNEFRHINMTGSVAEIPQVKAGDDVAELRWVNARDVTVDPSIAPQPFDSHLSRYHANTDGQTLPIRDAHGPSLDAAVCLARLTLVHEREKALGLTEPLAVTPSTALGPQAHALHLEHISSLGATLRRQVPGVVVTSAETRQRVANTNRGPVASVA